MAPSAIVVCHTTRYRDRNLGGITRIVGYGKLGKLACITLERVTSSLLAECKIDGKEVPARCVVAAWNGVRVAAVLRRYPATKPGHRQHGAVAQLIAAHEDLGLSLEAIERQARERYRIRDPK